jgi:prepilin-type N-terminal cleavage/methylation domain-containing protein
MPFGSLRKEEPAGFTLAEVLIAVAVCVIFAVAAYATNQRLLLSLRAERETTAASMMLQERMELFRGIYYGNLANPVASGTTYPATMTAGDIVQTLTTSEAQLGSALTETVTISGYWTNAGGPGYPGDGSIANVWTRSGGSTSPTLSSPSNATLASNYDLIQVDIKLSWTSANGRTRQRELSSVFGKGNIGVNVNSN